MTHRQKLGQREIMLRPVGCRERKIQDRRPQDHTRLVLAKANGASRQARVARWIARSRPGHHDFLWRNLPAGQLGNQVAANRKDQIIDLVRDRCRRVVNAVPQYDVAVCLHDVDRAARRVVALEGGEIADRLAQGRGMAQNATQWAKRGKCLALPKQHPDIVPAGQATCVVEDRQKICISHEGIRPNLSGRNTRALQHGRQADTVVFQHACQRDQSGCALHRHLRRCRRHRCPQTTTTCMQVHLRCDQDWSRGTSS